MRISLFTSLLATFALPATAAPAVQVGRPDVDITVKFPDSNPFGRVTNGVNSNLVNVRVTSHWSEPLKVVAVRGQYFESSGKERPLRQSTTLPLTVDLPPRTKSPLIPYRFHSENKIGEVGFKVFVDVVDSGRKKYSYLGYEGTVNVVEPAGSWFDLELLSLYLILSIFFGSIGYLIYSSYFPTSSSPSQSKRRTTQKPTAIVAKDDEIRDSKEAVGTTSTGLDESWIPEHHLRARSVTKAKK